MPLITDPLEIALHVFEQKRPTWEVFEREKNGQLLIAGIPFYMRLGFHLRRVTQAIMTMGVFVKMRHWKRSTAADSLHTLDPKAPHKSLYPNGSWDPFWRDPIQPPPEDETDTSILDNAAYYNRIDAYANRKR